MSRAVEETDASFKGQGCARIRGSAVGCGSARSSDGELSNLFMSTRQESLDLGSAAGGAAEIYPDCRRRVIERQIHAGTLAQKQAISFKPQCNAI